MTFLPRRASLVLAAAVSVACLQPVLATSASAASLSAPSKLAPNSFATAEKDPILTWNAVSGAGGYLVEMSRSSDWSDTSEQVAFANKGATAVASYALPQPLAHGDYFWRVRAVDGSANGPWSATADLDKAWNVAPSITGSTPTADATRAFTNINSAPWRFAWTALPDASSYEVEFSDYRTFAQPGTTQQGNLPDGTTTLDCLTDATSFTPYGTYAADGQDLNVDDCNFEPFVKNLIQQGLTTVYWRVRGVDDSDTANVTATSETESTLCFGVPAKTTATEPSAFAATTDALGTPSSTGQECSLWSSTSTVAFPYVGGDGTGSPGTPTGLHLSCTSCTAMPEISWAPVPHAVEYEVTIADDSSFTNDERIYQTNFLSLTPRDQLADYQAGAGYHVAVNACTTSVNNQDECGVAAETTFTKQTAPLTDLSTGRVANGEKLSWSDLLSNYSGATSALGAPQTEAKDYKVEVSKATDSSFSNPVLTATVDQTQYVASLPDGSYVWRVLPVDLTGNVLPAASGSSFSLNSPSLHITSKNGVSVDGRVRFVASQPVTGVTGKSVRLVPVRGGSAVAGKVSLSSTPTSWTIKPAKPLVTGARYALSVDASVQDLTGDTAVVTGGTVRTATLADNKSDAWTYSHGWSTHKASGAVHGSYSAAQAGRTAKIVVAGGRAELYGCKAPSMGSLDVTVDGKTVKVSEHQSFTRCGVVVWQSALKAGLNTITVAVAKGEGDVDAVKVS